jgi:hypothetical protein
VHSLTHFSIYHESTALLDQIPTYILTLKPQTETTKGTGGDIIILEEAAYVDSGFFYETVAPLMIVGTTTLIGISTLRDGINFYTRLIRLRDKATGLPMFSVMQVQLACDKCKEDGKATDCVHMLHLVPRWQSSDKHVKLKTIMQDRPGMSLVCCDYGWCLSGLIPTHTHTHPRPHRI